MQEQELSTLLAKDAIIEVMSRYCRAMDRIDAKLGYTVWHEDGTADYAPSYAGTGHGFIDWVCDFHRTLEGHSHQISNSLIEVKGDKAVSETYVHALLIEKEIITAAYGRYLDNWSCRDGVWAIDQRFFAYDANYVIEKRAQIGRMARDPSDRSYRLFEEFAAQG